MSSMDSSLHKKLLKPTPFFGVKLWVAIVICIALAAVLALSAALCCCLIFRGRRKQGFATNHIINPKSFTTPRSMSTSSRMMNRRLLSRNGWDIEMCIGDDGTPEKRMVYSDGCDSGPAGAGGRVYTLNEIQTATNGFADENVIGSGDYGVVYRGVLFDHTRVAVKKLFVNRSKWKDLATELEGLWCLRHKNLVKLLGYCMEGMFSLLVYEYADNGNLHQWLHEYVSRFSPLTWNIRMSIIQGIAKGLCYMHEDSETAMPHEDLKSSNILLDKQWIPKISDFGIFKFLCPERSPIQAPPVGMSGYIAPEISDACALDVKRDVYSFGILVMEIVSGRTSVQSSVTGIEEHLIDWMKSMVSEEKLDQVLDPKLRDLPSLKELKRIVLVALRCVDPDANNRPRMSDVIHMLEPRDLLLSDGTVVRRATSGRNLFKEILESAD